MLFCVVVVVVNAFCCHSSGYCLLPPALPTHPPQKKNRRVWGFDLGQRGLLQQNQIQSSHSKTGDLYMSNFLSELMNKNLPV